MLTKFCENSDPEFKSFVHYFKDNYFCNKHQWAYCYHLHAGINTKMHLERLHCTIKYSYLKGKKANRLDKGIEALMRLTRNRVINRIISINKGEISDKLQNIRNRHKHLSTLDPTVLVNTEWGWELPSEKSGEVYAIQENLQSCDCQLVCSECNICIHRYTCSCPDSAIKYNICKHIHLVAQTVSKEETATGNFCNMFCLFFSIIYTGCLILCL